MKKNDTTTWLLPVFGERENDDHCRALVWRITKSSRKYLLTLQRRFERCRKEDPSLCRMVYDAVPVDVQWLNDDKISFIEEGVGGEHTYPPDFDDCGSPIPAEGLYEKFQPELDTDDDRLYITRECFYFRVRAADTQSWYEAYMKWETLEGVFA